MTNEEMHLAKCRAIVMEALDGLFVDLTDRATKEAEQTVLDLRSELEDVKSELPELDDAIASVGSAEDECATARNLLEDANKVLCDLDTRIAEILKRGQ